MANEFTKEELDEEVGYYGRGGDDMGVDYCDYTRFINMYIEIYDNPYDFVGESNKVNERQPLNQSYENSCNQFRLPEGSFSSNFINADVSGTEALSNYIRLDDTTLSSAEAAFMSLMGILPKLTEKEELLNLTRYCNEEYSDRNYKKLLESYSLVLKVNDKTLNDTDAESIAKRLILEDRHKGVISKFFETRKQVLRRVGLS